MYNSQFKKWSPEFNKNKRKGQPPRQNPISIVKRTRPRRLIRQYESRHASPLRLALRSPDRFLYPEAILKSIDDYAFGIFGNGKWSWDSFQILPPDGVFDNMSAWQHISDQCFGASTLFRHRQLKRGMTTIHDVCAKLSQVVQMISPGMLVKLWRIAMTLHRTGRHFGDSGILSAFLRHFQASSGNVYHESHPVSRLADAMVKIPEEEVPDTLAVAYKRAIMAMQGYLGLTHSVILHMWSNYHKSFDKNGLDPTNLLSRYQKLLNIAEKQKGLLDEDTITVLHGFLYGTYYNAGDSKQAMKLSIEMTHRVKQMSCVKETPKWCLPTQGFAMATKILGLLYQASGDREKCCFYMEDAILILSRGDRECKTRAVMLVQILREWLTQWEDLQRAGTWELWESKLLSTIQEHYE